GIDREPIRTADDRLFPGRHPSRDLRRVQEIIAHQILGSFTVFGIAIAELGRNLLLEFIRQNIEVSARVKMKIVSNAVMKRENLFRNSSVALAVRAERFARPVAPMGVT